jgi:molybdate transport system substrate-binding protein
MLTLSPRRRKPVRSRRRFLAIAVAATVLSSLAPGIAAAPETVTVFAAASLKTALDAAAAAWEQTTGHRTRIAYGASSAMARQIEQGAPAEIFLSANSQWMDYLAGKGLIEPDSRQQVFGNSLVLIAPRQSPVTIDLAANADLVTALHGGRLTVANTIAVPAGQYAKQALMALGLWEQARPHLAETQDVRGALALVARGEAPLGIVYATDANAEPAVRVVAMFPDTSHAPIVYPAALVRPIANPTAAAFLAFLASEAGAKHFLAQGFVRLR